jgi:hypothetical protein
LQFRFERISQLHYAFKTLAYTMISCGITAATDLVRRPCLDSGAPHRDLARPLHGEKLPTSPFSSLIIRFAQTNLHLVRIPYSMPNPIV